MAHPFLFLSSSMTNPTPLSSIAQAVMIAATNGNTNVVNDSVYKQCIAAALRAAADLERQSPWPTSIEGCGARWMRDQLLAIAAELEGQ